MTFFINYVSFSISFAQICEIGGSIQPTIVPVLRVTKSNDELNAIVFKTTMAYLQEPCQWHVVLLWLYSTQALQFKQIGRRYVIPCAGCKILCLVTIHTNSIISDSIKTVVRMPAEENISSRGHDARIVPMLNEWLCNSPVDLSKHTLFHFVLFAFRTARNARLYSFVCS